MGSMQRRKGAEAERVVATMLKGVFPNASRRAAGEESQETQGIDLKNTPGFNIQVCHRGRISVHAKLAEVPPDPNGKPVLFHKPNRGEWHVTMYAKDWLEMVERN